MAHSPVPERALQQRPVAPGRLFDVEAAILVYARLGRLHLLIIGYVLDKCF